MKILSLNTYALDGVGGGTERTQETLLRMFKENGHEVVAVGTRDEAGSQKDDWEGITRWRVGVRNLYWPLPDRAQPGWKRKLFHLLDIYNIGMARRLGRILDIERPDVAIVNNLPGWSIAALGAMRRRKIPIVQILHDHYNICANSMMYRNDRNCVGQCLDCRLLRAPHRRLTNAVDAVVGVSRYILERHLAHGVYAKVPVKTVIHNVRSAAALGLEEAPALRAKHQAERGDIDIRFGFIGTLAPSKGIEYLLEVFAGLGNDRAELWVAGKGKPEYEAMLKAKFAGPRVRFLGQVKPKDFFTAIDVTIVPSLWQENYPGVVSESIAFGAPIIASRRGGIPEMMQNGVNGIIFDPDENGSLTAALRQFAENPNLVVAARRNAIANSTRYLDGDGWDSSYSRVIEAVISVTTLPHNLVKDEAVRGL